MHTHEKRRAEAIRKELQLVLRQEERRKAAAAKARPARWKQELEQKLPEKVYEGLQSAFGKAFSLVFRKGGAILEKSYRKDERLTDHRVGDYVLRHQGKRSELRRMRRTAGRANFANLTMTTVEGVGLGALGIGIPDIVLFITTLLRGIYETALSYGYAYDTPDEQLLILKMMEASLTPGDEGELRDNAVDRMLVHMPDTVGRTGLDEQIQSTASAFAMDMLLLKFIQGLPVVGLVGGAANPVYYNKVLRYVELKYRKRYLWQLLKREQNTK
ncbi:MAG: EcsC family protein [Ruminococcaceae bacterium]|nr:EcsC family protein [Oscillospiraceae bacterium]